jgi:peptide chain release factor 3
LQFEVIKYRLEHEYKASCDFVPLSFYKACWLTSDNPVQLQEFILRKAGNMGYDKDNNPVFLAPSAWLLQQAQTDYKDIMFHTTSEFKGKY